MMQEVPDERVRGLNKGWQGQRQWRQGRRLSRPGGDSRGPEAAAPLCISFFN
jgi:hypothetical protein